MKFKCLKKKLFLESKLITMLILLSSFFSNLAWDYSAWIRTYALYLEEKLECIRVVKYDVETEPVVNLFL